MTQRNHKLFFLQYARAAGALLVIIVHLSTLEPRFTGYHVLMPCDWVTSYRIFFVVSGFVLTYAYMTTRAFDPFNFLLRRLWRVYPTYWEFTLILLPFYLWHPEMVNALSQPPDLLLSFLMLPQGDRLPLVGVAWTMVYELFFYFVFIGGMMMLRGRIPLFAFLWALFIYLGHSWFHDSPNSWVQTLFYGENYYFLPGIICGWLYVRSNNSFDLPYWKPLVEIGNATYSIYLSHEMVMNLLVRIWQYLNMHGLPADNMPLHCLGLLIIIAACIIAGWLNYRFIEKPLTTWGNKRIGRLTHKLERQSA